MEKTRAASEAELVELLVPRLRRMLRAGTTTVECKVSAMHWPWLINCQGLVSKPARPNSTQSNQIQHSH